MTRVLMVGYSRGFLRGLADAAPPRSVVVLEEPDIIRKRGVHEVVRELPCVARVVPATYHQARDFLGTGLALNRRWRFEAVVPGVEYAVPAAAALAERLGLPGATERAALTLRDKLRLRAVTARAGVRNPEWREIAGPEDLLRFAGDGPVVIKPADRQASVGVQVLDGVTAADAPKRWRELVEADEAAQLPDRPLRHRYIAERRLLGPEHSVEALTRNGELLFLNVTEKAVMPGPRPIELGHVVPAPLARATLGRLRRAMRALVAATGFQTGVLHAEWILTTDGPALVECAGRCPGDRIVDLIDIAYTMRLRESLIDLLAGRTPELPHGPRAAAAIQFLEGQPGRVTRVEGVDALRGHADVKELRVDVGPGDELREWRSSWDRPGYAIVTGPDGAAVRARARAVAGAARIVTA